MGLSFSTSAANRVCLPPPVVLFPSTLVSVRYLLCEVVLIVELGAEAVTSSYPQRHPETQGHQVTERRTEKNTKGCTDQSPGLEKPKDSVNHKTETSGGRRHEEIGCEMQDKNLSVPLCAGGYFHNITH